MDETPNLQLPYIMAAQSQKHVTHNEAIRALDAIVQLSVADRDLGMAPAAPADGDRYIVSTAPSGLWAGHANHVAAWQDGAWAFYIPDEGWLAWVADEDRLVAWDGSGWAVASGGSVNPVPLVGVNATADAANRLAVSSPGSLLNHEGAGHQQRINKAAAGDTASVLFQTAFSGRAEVGLTGDDKLHVKVSPDGAAWTDALCIDPATGFIGIGTPTPEGPIHILRTGALANSNPFHERVDSVTNAPSWTSRKARGTAAAKTAVQSGDLVQGFFGQGYDGGAYVGAANLRWVVDGTVSAGIVPTRLEFNVGVTTGGQVPKFEIKPDGTARPSVDNAQSCGDATNRWSALWAANGTVQTSDVRDKDVVGRLSFAGAMIDMVDPVLFRWHVGGNEQVPSATETEVDDAGTVVAKMITVPKPGKRTHAGFLAQDIRAAMDAAGADFAAWGLDDRDDPTSRQHVRPDQLIAVLWAALRETRAEVAALRRA